MIIDTHIHMGQFYDRYFTPEYISTLMQKCGVSFYLISSTTTCEENYDKVSLEFKKLLEIDGDKALPCLWLTERILDNDQYLSNLLAMHKWRCLKIHPSLHPEEWGIAASSTNSVFKTASEHHLPLLIHTGEDEICCSNKYEDYIKSYNDVNVILAHGRPLDQALDLCHKYPNVYIDTAFMPAKQIFSFVRDGDASKILWGTDMFLPILYYPKIPPTEYYKKKLAELSKGISMADFNCITEMNAKKLFEINI